MATSKATYRPASDLVTDLVVGMSDGLLIPFALATGLYKAGVGSDTILLTGLSWVAIGSMATGFGSYFTRKNEKVAHTSSKQNGGLEIVANIGLDEETISLMTDEAAKETEQWLEMKRQYELDTPDVKAVRRSSINIGVFYFLGGLIPLFPYIIDTTDEAFRWSLVITISSLFLFGYFKGKVTDRSGMLVALRMIIIGGIMAAAAYYIAGLL